MINRNAEIVVGLNFKSNTQKAPNRYWYVDEAEGGRAVAVYSAAMIEALKKLCGADKLVKEIIDNRMQGALAKGLESKIARPFVVITGLPGSGKTTLARQLGPALNLPVIDKDDILERLFEFRGVGDPAWRRALSREADEILRREASSSEGAVLVSFWRLPGMAPGSGTPMEWVAGLSSQIVSIHCFCEPEVAAKRFLGRTRHPGHLDLGVSYEELVVELRELSLLKRIKVGQSLEINTLRGPDLNTVVRDVRAALARCQGSDASVCNEDLRCED